MPARIMADATKLEQDHQFLGEALRWLPDVTRFALSITRDEADADDLVQETFLKAYEAWGSYTLGTECRDGSSRSAATPSIVVGVGRNGK